MITCKANYADHVQGQLCRSRARPAMQITCKPAMQITCKPAMQITCKASYADHVQGQLGYADMYIKRGSPLKRF